MNDISLEQITLQLDFLKGLDLFCIFKFIITNDIEIYREESYNILINIINSYKIINIEESNHIFSEYFSNYRKGSSRKRGVSIPRIGSSNSCSGSNGSTSGSSINTKGKNISSNDNIINSSGSSTTTPYSNQYNAQAIQRSKTKVKSNKDEKNAKIQDIYMNDSLFSKNMYNKKLFEFFKFPKSKKVAEYVNMVCVNRLIKEPLNMNLSFVKFDKKKKKRKKRRRRGNKNNSRELYIKNKCKYNSDSGIVNKKMKSTCSCCYETKENYKELSKNFKKLFNETDISVSDSSEILSTLKISFAKTHENNYLDMNCSNSDDDSAYDFDYYSETTTMQENQKEQKNVKLQNKFLSLKLSMYNSSLLKNRGAHGDENENGNENGNSNGNSNGFGIKSIINEDNTNRSNNIRNSGTCVSKFYDETTLCFKHYYDIHNILNRDPNGLRKIKIMLKKDIGTISISPFFINFDCTRIFKNVCKAFNLTKYDYKKQSIHQIINLCFNTENSLAILKNIFLDDLYKQQKVYVNELNNKKNYRKKEHNIRKKNTESVLDILDDEKRINVLYFINRFLYSQKTPLSNLFRDYTLSLHSQKNVYNRVCSNMCSGTRDDMHDVCNNPLDNQSEDPPFDELTIDYLIFLMIFEKKIDQKFYKFLIRKINKCKINITKNISNKNDSSSDFRPNIDYGVEKETEQNIATAILNVHNSYKRESNDNRLSTVARNSREQSRKGNTNECEIIGDHTKLHINNGTENNVDILIDLNSLGDMSNMTNMENMVNITNLTDMTDVTDTTNTTHITGMSNIVGMPNIGDVRSVCSVDSASCVSNPDSLPSSYNFTKVSNVNNSKEQSTGISVNDEVSPVTLTKESNFCNGEEKLSKLLITENTANEKKKKKKKKKKEKSFVNKTEVQYCNEGSGGYELNSQNGCNVKSGISSCIHNGIKIGINRCSKGSDQANGSECGKMDGDAEEEEEYMDDIEAKTSMENEIILLKCIRPFPTIYWLINKNICGYISHLEKVNIIKNIENFINRKSEDFNLLRYYLIYDHLKYIVIRLRHINKKILIFFYNIFLNTDNFLRQYTNNTNDEETHIINSTYNNSFELNPIILNVCLQKYNINLHVVLEILRKINTLRIKGIGGISNFLTLKCMHLYFASHLSYPNTIGYILEECLKS
ncbi:rhoptry protein RHOP148, putative [Plasmodium malariae]|uniref:Rhoptry protein RHOP148, putative n=1 Tax=Plasmodium malariae TaxID=5858 RepID=A0A1C3KZ84_PLAMA|nr:rhoptry protein RHOP148, putative [Plasmodium malariae]